MSGKELGFPTIGEVISFFLKSIGIQVEGSIKKSIQRLKIEKNYDLERFPEILEFIKKELSEVLGNQELINELILLLNTLLLEYKKNILENTGTNKKITIKFMLISMTPKAIIEIKSLNFNFKNLNRKLWFLPKIEDNKISKYPIDNIFKHYYQLKEFKSRDELAKAFSKKIYGNKEHIDEYKQNFYRWSNNKTDINLNSFFQELEQFENDKKLLFDIKLLFMVTKSIHFSINLLKKELGESFLFKYIESINNFYLYEDISSFNNLYKQLNKDIKKRESIFIKIQELKQNQLSLIKIKNKNSKKEAIQIIKKIQDNEYGHEFISYITWFKARLNILSGNLKEAHEFYKLAFENGKYIMGQDLKDVIKEGIFLAVWFDDKNIVKKLYKFGIYFDLFKEPYEKVKSWFIRDKKTQFYSIFSLHKFFSDANIDNLKINKENIYKRYFHFENSIDLDLKNPNKKIKKSDEYTTQLYEACLNRDVNKVKDLLNSGADSNWKKNDNSHALLITVQTQMLPGNISQKEKATEIANLILNSSKLKPETINSITNRKKISAMHEVISWGNINLLEKMLKKGGDVNLKATLDNSCLLYYTLQQFSMQKIGFNGVKNLTNIYEDVEGAMAGNEFFTNALFNDELKDILKNIENLESSNIDINNLMNISKNIIEGNVNEINVKEIIELLLKYNANVDLKGKKGYTPVLFSAEIGNLEIFRKLLSRSKNILDETNDKDTVLSISLGFKKYNISEFLLRIPEFKKVINKFSLNNKIGYVTPLTKVVHYVVISEKHNIKDLSAYEMIKLLLQKGANPYIKGDISAIELAFEYGNRELIELFGNFK